jgi:glycosyltransferase involved in cell wall biosynthesis
MDDASHAKKRVLVVGPTPPPHHGVAMFTQSLLDGVRDPRFELLHLDTSDRRDARNIGCWDLTNVWLGVSSVVRLGWRCAVSRPAIVYIPISQNVPAFLRDALFVFLARLFRRRVVLHLHGGYLRILYEHPSGEDRRGLKDGGFRALVRRTLGSAAAIVVLAPEFRAIFDGLVPDERVAVVANGVPDPGAWDIRQKAARTPEPGGGTVLYMGALTRTKGIMALLHAVAVLKKTRPSVRLRVAGAWTEDAVRAESEELMAREDLGAHVEFAGNVTGAAKAEFLASGDVFCLPTRYPYEGQPLVILEALAAGLPVVATRHAALASTLGGIPAGRLIPVDARPGVLAGAIDELLCAGSEVPACARQRYLDQYTLDICHKCLLDLFAKVGL